MSILIKGMKMPVKGYRLLLIHADGTVQSTDGETTAVPVPDHGRLIDANALIKVFKTKTQNPLNQETTPYSWAFAYECLADVVGDMPTVIPASKEGE